MVSIASYIALRLQELGCNHVFGVPGTSCSDFFSTVEDTAGIDAVVTANELEAGYAADGYARFAGFGTCCVAYGVGTLSAINALTGSLVEKVPVLMLNGGPSQQELDDQERYGVLFSHSTGLPALDYRLFNEISVAAHVVSPDEDIPAAIDNLLRAALMAWGPVYLEIPNDLWLMQIPEPTGDLLPPATPPLPGADFPAFLEAATQKAEAAQNPTVLLGVELVRKGLADDALAMIEAAGYPFATTVLSKSIIAESHPLFRGTYDTDLVVKPVRELLESSDCLIALGCVFGVDHLTLVSTRYDDMINISFGDGRIGGTFYTDIDVQLFLQQFRPQAAPAASARRRSTPYPDRYASRRASWVPDATETEEHRLTHEVLFTTVDDFLRESGQRWTTVLDTCLGSFPGADLVMQGVHEYAANPVWLSIGHGTPAAYGVHFATRERPLLITGDGGFQMVAQAVSTMVKYRVPAIVLIIDNGAYAIEQYLIDSCFFVREGRDLLPFVGLNSWNYETMPELFGGGQGVKVNSGDELRAALDAAMSVVDGPSIISAQVPADDLPPENVQYAEAKCSDEVVEDQASRRWHLPSAGQTPGRGRNR